MAGTARRKIGPRLINQQTPAWAVRLIAEHVAPREGEAGFDAWFDWMFCGGAGAWPAAVGHSRGPRALVGASGLRRRTPERSRLEGRQEPGRSPHGGEGRPGRRCDQATRRMRAGGATIRASAFAHACKASRRSSR